MLTAQAVKDYALSLGFTKVGIAPATPGQEVERLRAWLDRGYHADMEWMRNPKRQDINQILPGVKSVISVALNYYTPHKHRNDRAKISRYGWGKDYHKVLGKKLKQLAQWIEAQTPCQTRYYVDTGPIMEKAWAERAGIGWIGKHSNLITKDYGSWVFLGEVLTTLDLEPDRPHTEHCGTCIRCIVACPTQAIVAPFVVDARKCIAYHTIENRAPILPPAIVENLQNWVAGCDICQDVCPWNRKFAKETTVAEFHPYPGNLNPDPTELAEMTDQEWEQKFNGSALKRIKPEQWRRNAKAIQTTDRL
ncbi:MAG: tRNA epoxyqueuosine(34) reductase QueG [Pseudanabaenaceae cyanobacterium SKYGB_i_bin29]|nr:tRNA epoxyqueuosine(34) reductase QueG [Pseudanabaenaceae cyanobacterium SKYG29]MDW8421355.1 tRNA epoxyqueuosine(34) reductase QueG [Pseudanabaenaceae cyanobacterium SKYGB_i_bin29]